MHRVEEGIGKGRGSRLVMLAMAAAVFAIAGCGKKETPPKEQQPAAQAPATAPAPTSRTGRPRSAAPRPSPASSPR